LIANTKKQALAAHCFAVGLLSKKLTEAQSDSNSLSNIAFLAGVFHDIGKVDPAFQDWAQKGKSSNDSNGEHIGSGTFSFEQHARHNEISLLIAHLIIGVDRSEKKAFAKKNKLLNRFTLETLFHAIYWHHAKPLRKVAFDDLLVIYKKSISHNLSTILSAVSSVFSDVNTFSLQHNTQTIHFEHDLDNIEDMIDELIKIPVPSYKKYIANENKIEHFVSTVQLNAENNIVRSSLIYADKLVSSLTPEALETHIHNQTLETLLPVNHCQQLKTSIQKHVDSFYPDTQQTKDQDVVSTSLAVKKGLAVLSGAAGSGKTKIGLEWALKSHANKIYWVVPKISIAQSIFNELSSTEYLPGATIELFTGEYKLSRKEGKTVVTPDANHLTGNIIVTTIDQVISGITTQNKTAIFTDFMLSHVVMDEYHEYIKMTSFNLLFSELMHGKMMKNNKTKTLIVSATPHYCFLNDMFDIRIDDIVEMKTTHTGKYKITFNAFDEGTELDIHPLYRTVEDGTIVISNTATVAQNSFMLNLAEKNAGLFHSKYASKDKQAIFFKVFNAFKRDGTKEMNTLRAGPIIQASLNITCSNMISEITTPEDTLQRIGRLNRFDEFDKASEFLLAVPKSVRFRKNIDNSSRFLASLHSFDTVTAWYYFLISEQTTETTLAALYALYKKFYSTPDILAIIAQETLQSLNESALTLNQKIADPLWIKPKGKKKNLLKKVSLRGDSRYTQMAVAHVSDENIVITEDYAITPDNQLTISLSALHQDNKAEYPVNFMIKKHHQMASFKQQGAKKVFSPAVALNNARQPDSPIYASYTPSDIASVGCENTPYSQLYLKSEHQVIGYMKMSSIIAR